MARPSGRLMAGVPAELVLAQTGTVAVTLSRIAACEDGFEAELAMFATEELEDSEYPWRPHMHRGTSDPARAMRFGVRYPDGSKAELNAMWESPARPPEGPVIRQAGGSGGDGEWRQDLWFWPLPGAGRLQFALEWKSQGIELQLHELDAAPLREAAARSHTIFDPASLVDAADSHTLGTIHLVEEPDEESESGA